MNTMQAAGDNYSRKKFAFNTRENHDGNEVFRWNYQTESNTSYIRSHFEKKNKDFHNLSFIIDGFRLGYSNMSRSYCS
jgi:hypothetical protein